MLTHFDSLFDLLAAFPDEQSCLDHVRSIRWKDGKILPTLRQPAHLSFQR